MSPGKGQGLIAVCPIRPGDLIVSERALIFLPSSTNAALETVRQYRQLGKDQKKTYLSLCNSFDEDGGRNPEEGRARHNDEEDNVIGKWP